MKKTVILIGVIVIAALAVGAVAFAPYIRQAMSVAKSATMDEETIAAEQEKNAQLEQDIREKYQIPQMEMTDEMRAAVESGSMTIEEAVREMLAQSSAQDAAPETAPDGQAGTEASDRTEQNPESQTDPEAPADSETPSGTAAQTDSSTQTGTKPDDTAHTDTGITPADTTKPADTAKPDTKPSDTAPADTGTKPDNAAKPADTAQTGTNANPDSATAAPQPTAEEKRLQELAAQLYVLRDYFTAQVEGILDECIDEFLALPVEQQTKTAKIRIVTARLGRIADMEQDCDAKVAAIVSEVRTIDPDLADLVQQEYESEKATKKASVIAQYS